MLERGRLQVRIDAEQRPGVVDDLVVAAVRRDIVLHRAEPEPAARIGRAVVAAIERLVRFGIVKPFEGAGFGVDAGEAGMTGRDQRATIAAGAHAGHHFGHRKGSRLAADGIEPVQARGGGNVDPPQPAAARIPECAFAEPISGAHRTFDTAGQHLPSGRVWRRLMQPEPRRRQPAAILGMFRQFLECLGDSWNV